MYTYTLPSGQEVELVELTGREEELLTNQRLIKSGEAINQVLLNCIKRIGENKSPKLDDILNLLSGDRLFILVKLRQISLGDTVDLELICPACKETSFITVNLEELPVIPYHEEREFSFKLPTSKKQVKFGYLNGHKEKQLALLKEPSLTSAMLARIVSVDGNPPNKKVITELPMRDRSELRREMLKVDAGIDTEVEVICQGCGNRIKTRLEGEPNFLFPSLG
jgi:hypothetical protein